MSVNLPLPYAAIPESHQPVGHETLYDVLSPVLRGSHGILSAMHHPGYFRDVDPNTAADALMLIASQLKIASDMLERWYRTSINP